jgi:osmotically-inducible protein OsmY
MKTVTSVRDSEIAGEIIRRLAHDGRLNVSDIVRVHVVDGEVDFVGTVHRAEQVRIAHEIAAAVPGVRTVNDSLAVSIPLGSHDAQLSARAVAVLAAHSDPLIRELGVRVEDGIAHIYGQVPDAAREMLAVSLVGQVPGVEKVVSEIWVGEVRPEEASVVADDAVIRGRVLELLTDNGVNIYNNRATVEHEIVHLRGHVLTPRESADAERLALTVPGVQSVKNELITEVQLTSRGPDEELAARVLAAISRAPNAPAAYLRAICYGGDVYLRGEVDTVEQIKPALEATWRVPGVNRVLENIVVISRSAQPSGDKGALERGALRQRRGGRR